MTSGHTKDPRMVSGAVISNVIFFQVVNGSVGADGSFRATLQALPRHEVWLESCEQALADLIGTLDIVGVTAPAEAAPIPNFLSRDAGDSYSVRLHLPSQELARLCSNLPNYPASELMLAFDVEYREGYESPGGYAPDYGIRYWDDRQYPSVAIDRFEFTAQ